MDSRILDSASSCGQFDKFRAHGERWAVGVVFIIFLREKRAADTECRLAQERKKEGRKRERKRNDWNGRLTLSRFHCCLQMIPTPLFVSSPVTRFFQSVFVHLPKGRLTLLPESTEE